MIKTRSSNLSSYPAQGARPIGVITALVMLWSLVGFPLAAGAQASVKAVHPKVTLPPIKIYPAPKPSASSRKPGPPIPLFDYRAAELADAKRAKPFVPQPLTMPVTLLGQFGDITPEATTAQVAAWKREENHTKAPSARLAQLHLWLGEIAMNLERNPDGAHWHFRMAESMTKDSDPIKGIAAYDNALCLLTAGSYRQSELEFSALMQPGNRLMGFSRPACAIMLRRAAAAYGYHRERAVAGIPEPPHLDRMCAAAALATAMRANRMPYDRATILKAIHVDGYGSTLGDILSAGPKVGMDIRAVVADDKGLVMLPKPCIAHVEHDHFCAVTKADATGVTYLCSDCGPWPGGAVHLTWKQWKFLEPGIYATVTKPGTAWDRALSHLGWKTEASANVRRNAGLGLVPAVRSAEGIVADTRIASAGALNRVLGGSEFSAVASILPVLRGHVDRYIWDAWGFHCGVGCAGPVSNGNAGGTGPSLGPAQNGGDPVSLATGAELYNPPADLTVYNPAGPPVVWSRLYSSDRNYTNVEYTHGDCYEGADYGAGWSQSYNMAVFDPLPQQYGPTNYKYIILPNGADLWFTAPNAPSPGTPVQCSVMPGAPVMVQWNYSADGNGTFQVTWSDRTVWQTGTMVPGKDDFPITQITDRNGNSLSLHYTATVANQFPLLTSISGATGTLLTINRCPDGNWISSVTDCYGRSVFYNVDLVPNDPMNERDLDHVSQVVPSCASTIPDRYDYTYELIGLQNASDKPFAALHTKTVPSPTGTGSSTATINYNQNSTYVTSTFDGNGNEVDYFSSDQYGNYTASTANYTTLIDKSAAGATLYQYTAGFNSNLNATTVTNGSGVVTTTMAYADPNDPYMPSTVTDSNGHTWSATYDQYGNTLTVTQPSPRSTVTTNTYSYSSFALGELTSTHTGSKQATTVTYYEPSGHVHQINSPTPGTVGGSSTVTSSIVYDTLGNVTSVTTPGNATSSTITTTFGYTIDGSYSQPEAIGEPLTITDNLGKVAHLRYDSQGNVLSGTDALGNEVDETYDIVNNTLRVTAPATGETGPGRSYSTVSYQYPDGPVTSTSAYDESGNLTRTQNISYGLDGETLSLSGSTEPTTYGYDGLERLHTLTDGNGHTTTYSFNANSYLASISYPNANSGTGYDIVSFPSYNAQGDLLTRIDGRGIETDYAYADPDNLLTSVTYPATPSMNASYSHDGYGRVSGVTDGATAALVGAGIAPNYDDNDDVTSVQTTYVGATSGTYLPTQTISYNYNNDGSRASMVTPAGTFTYAFDGDGRLNSLTNPFSETSSWTYLDNGWLKTRSLSNGVTSTNTFNALGELLDMSTKNSSSSVLSDFSVPSTGGYDAVGNILSRTDTITGVSAYSGSTSYTYDIKDQLTQEASTRASGYTNNFALDAGTITGAGNPTTFKGASNTFNADNQYTNTGYTYDGEGNPTTYKGTSLTFDAEDRMTGYGTALTNGYMTSGLRAWKQNAAGTRTYFLYDGITPICELDSTGAVTATNTFGATGLMSRRVGSTSTFYTFDTQGGNAQRLNASGTVTGSSMFDAYGTSASTDGTTDPYSGYGAEAGYYTDSETGLELCTARFYDPSNGRFINRDPLGYAGGINLYNYTGNRGINGIDPLGLDSWTAFGAGVAVGCGAIGYVIGAVMGANAGGDAGGLLGTAVEPGVGTVVGAVVGASTGACVGAQRGGIVGGLVGVAVGGAIAGIGRWISHASSGSGGSGCGCSTSGPDNTSPPSSNGPNGYPKGSGGKPVTKGHIYDQHSDTQQEALAKAAKAHGVNEPFESESTPMYGKNKNLLGKKGEPWEQVHVSDGENDATIDGHVNGHHYEDTGERELPHYHGPGGVGHYTWGTWDLAPM